MELSPKQQVVDILKRSERVLFLTHANPDGDALGSQLAFSLALKKLNKEAVAVSSGEIAANYAFLSEIKNLVKEFKDTKDFVISLDVSKVQAEKVLYKMNGDKLNIIVSPKEGEFKPEMLSSASAGHRFDLIVVLDCPDLERLGSIYESNAELFFDVPVVNIDHHPGNDMFGAINLVDITATSTAEILVSVIESLSGDPKFVSDEIATSLLTGIITDTNSFQNSNTTPKSLTVAAQLVAGGAKQQEIIKNIYKTKPLSTLKLWGRALSRLTEEKASKFVWATLSKKDFAEVGAQENESSGVIDELLKSASGIDFALLLSEKGEGLHGSLRSTNKLTDVSQIAKLFGGGGHTMAAAFQLQKTSLKESQDKVIGEIKKFQEKQKVSL